MLGLRQLGVVAHGRFTRKGFARAIEVAAHGVEENVIARTRAALEEAGALRSSASRGDGGGEDGGTSAEAATVVGP
jgi:glycerol-3-phosphate acyltransferase PlsX